MKGSPGTGGGHGVIGNQASRSSIPWTSTDNPAVFALRYLIPMRDQILELTRDDIVTDEALRMVLAHLVSKGFGEHHQGRLRDYLIRISRAAVKGAVGTVSRERPEQAIAEFSLSDLRPDNPNWVRRWRAELVSRTWRTIERREHAQPERPLFTVLRMASDHPSDNAKMIAARILTETEVRVDPINIPVLYRESRRAFAEILADEIAETVDATVSRAIEDEVRILGLNQLFGELRT